jgi:hypothetical protein
VLKKPNQFSIEEGGSMYFVCRADKIRNGIRLSNPEDIFVPCEGTANQWDKEYKFFKFPSELSVDAPCKVSIDNLKWGDVFVAVTKKIHGLYRRAFIDRVYSYKKKALEKDFYLYKPPYLQIAQPYCVSCTDVQKSID